MSDYEQGMRYAAKAFRRQEWERHARRVEMVKQKAIGALLCILALGAWALLAVNTEEGTSGLWWGVILLPIMAMGIYTMGTKRNWTREINEMGVTE